MSDNKKFFFPSILISSTGMAHRGNAHYVVEDGKVRLYWGNASNCNGRSGNYRMSDIVRGNVCKKCFPNGVESAEACITKRHEARKQADAELQGVN